MWRRIAQFIGLTRLVVGFGQSSLDPLEGSKVIAADGRVQGRLDQMIPGNHRRVILVHKANGFAPCLGLPDQALRPTRPPLCECTAQGRVELGVSAFGEVPEKASIVGTGLMHAAEQFVGEISVFRFGIEESQLGPQGGEPVALKTSMEGFQRPVGQV